MRLEKLSLYNFKNYSEAQLDFSGKIQCFLGKNGSGKSNLLDAIHYLAFTKSAVNPSDQQNIRRGENQFLIKGEFVRKNGNHQVVCNFQLGHKKVILEDTIQTPRLSDHIGKYPVVLVAPKDIELIWDGGETRRKFFDSLLSQIDKNYLENLIIYDSHLKQRNSLLRLFSENGKTDEDMLEAYDKKIVPAGEYIHGRRKEFMMEFLPLFENHYRFLVSDSPEEVLIEYRSQLSEADFRETLRRNLQRDILLQRTGAGIHRDDFLFSLNDGELRRFASQGQQKSFLIGLKLTEFQIIAQHKEFKPLLLLDDIFDKLDDDRIRRLMTMVAGGTFGQLLMTDARAGRSRDVLGETGLVAEVFEVRDGSLIRS